MKLMQKVNRQIKVEDKDVEGYLADGWDEIDKKGKVVQNGAGAKKVATLETAVEALQAENAALKAELEKAKPQ